MSWEYTTVGDNISTKKGFAFKSTKYVEKGAPIVRVSDFTIDSISDDDLKYYPEDEYEEYKDYIIRNKDIIIQTVGSWQYNPESVVGKVVRVPYNLDGALLNQNAVKLIPKKTINKDFLYYRLKMNDFKGHVIGEARGAANQASITLDIIKAFAFMMPELETQYRIAGILQAYDDLIENNQNQIKLLEEAARRLYKEWFVDLHFPGHERTKNVDGVPEGWHMGTVQEVIEYHDTKRKPLSGQQREKMKGEYRYYGAAGILDYVNAFLFDGVYLLLGEDGTVVSYNGCPVLQYVTGQFWVNNHAHVLTGKGKYSTEYIYMMFAHMKILDVVTGVAQPKISQGRLSAKKILIPASELAVAFDVNAKPFFDKILILENQIKKLEEARDRLLPKLMSGEIEL